MEMIFLTNFFMDATVLVNFYVYGILLVCVVLPFTRYKSSEWELHTKWFSFKSTKKK